jgi:hypothetical protein
MIISAIVDCNDGVLHTIETVSKGSSCRLIDHSEDLQPSNLTCVLSCLTLGIIEVYRDGDDSMAMNRRVSVSREVNWNALT